ncbi:tetratricopeptide repeat protein [Actinomadura roseirufa]|uniref:tetratricopeptide repeat protein n=1 Tax=Actinomadura roseirufa TaxID=2094049 RepID=UPI00104117DA|nr:hypothetical protein [Actinomadura roseirufa]
MHVHKGVHLHGQMHLNRVIPAPALHQAIVCADVQGYGDLERTDWDRITVRDGLYAALRGAFDASGAPWASCYHEDRGDGALILVPPTVPKERLACLLPGQLAAHLDRHNERADPGARIRLRLAVHAGEVHQDAHGVVGSAINTAFRLLDSAPLRRALRGASGSLALIASDWFYREVVWQSPLCDPDTYRRVPVTVKETRTQGWIRLPEPPDRTRALLGSLTLGQISTGSLPPSGEDEDDIFSCLPLALWTFCFPRRPWADVIDAVHGALTAARAGDDGKTAYALCALGYAHAGLRQFTAALDCFQQARDTAPATERRATAWALLGLGYAHHGLDQIHPAIARYRHAVAVFGDLGEPAGQAETLYNLGRAYVRLGRSSSARDSWLTSLALFETLQSPQAKTVQAHLQSLSPVPL